MAVTENQLPSFSDASRAPAKVAASVRLYEGTLAFITAGGYATNVTATGVNFFGGIVVADTDNSSGADGALTAELRTDGVVTLAGTGFTQALVGNKIYAIDNYTVTGTSTNNTLIGYCTEYLSATAIRVRMRCGEV